MGMCAGLIVCWWLLFTSACAKKQCPPYSNETESCPITIRELDFLHENSHDPSDVKWHRDVQRNWPCAVRLFWVKGWFHIYVGIVRYLYKWVLLVLIALGVLLNSFAMASIRAKRADGVLKPCCSLMYTFCQYQCIFDIGALLVACSMGYARSFIPVFDHLFLENIWLCKAFKIFTAMGQFSSPWMNVIIAINRLCDIKFPEKMLMMPPKRAHGIMIILVSIVALISSTKFYFSGFEQYSTFEYERCEEPGHTVVPVIAVYVALATWLPTVILLGVNYLLVRVVKELKYPGESSELMLKRNKENQKIIRTIWMVSIFYAAVQIPLGIVETIELYWNMIFIKTVCRSVRETFAHWRNVKITLKWFRASLYLSNQLGFIINFSCLLLTREDFYKLGVRMKLVSAAGTSQRTSS